MLVSEREWAERLGREVKRQGHLLATAESCTGGLLSHWITNVPGSSDWFAGGVVAYSNSVKEQLLSVPPALITEHGAVSEPVALAMARGVRTLLGAQVSVAITGIAGPTGAVPGKPVGTTFVAIVTRETHLCRRYRWRGSREDNKTASALAALQLLMDALDLTQGS